MKKKRFSESQIVEILKAGEGGVPIPELSRKYGFGYSTYYAWKAKYSGMSVSELRRLKAMYADLSLDHKILKEILEKKFSVPMSDENQLKKRSRLKKLAKPELVELLALTEKLIVINIKSELMMHALKLHY